MVSSRPPYPPTSGGDEVEILHGESIPDPYRWLEQGDDPRTQAWTASQNALTESLLATVPARARLRARAGAAPSRAAPGPPEPPGPGARTLLLAAAGRPPEPACALRP